MAPNKKMSEDQAYGLAQRDQYWTYLGEHTDVLADIHERLARAEQLGRAPQLSATDVEILRRMVGVSIAETQLRGEGLVV